MSTVMEEVLDQATEQREGISDRTCREQRTERRQQTRKQPRYNVILLDDDDHTYAYVVEMLGKLFHYPRVRAFKMAREVDKTGRAILMTTSLELAELKRDQVMAYGADPWLEASCGSMRATIEPVEE